MTRTRPGAPAWRLRVAAGLTAVVLASACGSSPDAAPTSPPPATPLHAAPEPAVSPPAQATLPGTVLAFAGAPEGVAVDAAGEVAVNVRRPDGVVLFPLARPSDRRTVALGGSARHLVLAGPDGPLLVPDESDNTFVELALPSGRILESVRVGNHPHDAIAVGPSTIFVADELANTISIIRAGRVAAVVAAPLQPGGMAANPAGTRAIVVGVRGRRVTEYTAAGVVVGSANCGAGPTHAVTGDGGLYWVADTLGGAILGFRLGAHGPVQVATIPVGSHPYGLAFDARLDTLWVTITGTDELLGLRFDGVKVASRMTYATVRQPNTVAVDATTGELVVTGSTQPGQLQLLAGPT
jgi:DNA-binding beta-propeller fold protein YncE